MAADVSHWIDRLESDDWIARGEAAESLAKMGEAAKPAAVALVKQAGRVEESLREWVVSALENIGAPNAGDTTALRELVSSADPDVAYWAITLLGRLESGASPAVPDLVEVLVQNPHPHNRQRAAWALGKIGPVAKEALPALKTAAHAQDPRLSRIAMSAIESIADPH